MYIGLGIVLIVLGAILVFALDVNIPGVGDDTLGFILMAAGALAILLSFALSARLRGGMTTVRQSQIDPATGSRMERTDIDPR
jgi:ABC-type amino acid transport system permease subunit